MTASKFNADKLELFKKGVLLGAFFLVLLMIVRRAWMGDDAFISLRTVDNFVNGYGLVWNPGFRVQSFTNPLWVLLLSLFYFFTREPYFTTLAISITVTGLAVWLIFFRANTSFAVKLTTLCILISSNAFIDFSTSGLENPLSYLFLAIFGLIYFRHKSSRRLLLLSLVAGLAGLNRLDILLLYIPMLAMEFWRSQTKRQAIIDIGLGFLPVAVWEIFSLLYYGLPFPSTYYSKLGAGISIADYWSRGLQYLYNSLQLDTITLVSIFIIILLALWQKKQRLYRLPAVFGILLYLVYVVSIGGDFMAGRFLSVPLFASIVLLSGISLTEPGFWGQLGVVVAILLVGFSAPLPTYKISDPNYAWRNLETGVFDARVFYSDSTGLLNQFRGNSLAKIQLEGQKFREQAATSQEKIVLLEGAIGFLGYYAGPEVIIIDYYGLTDPLRAQLPAMYNPKWRTGHFIRYEIIPGYEETLSTGVNQIKDSRLHTFYDYLNTIVSEPIWNVERLVTIYHLNVGDFDRLIDTFYFTYPEVVERGYSKVNTVVPIKGQCSSTATFFKEQGLVINIPPRFSNASSLRLFLLDGISYRILFYDENQVVDYVQIGISNQGMDSVVQYDVLVPSRVIQRGFDQLQVLPRTSLEETKYCLEYLQLN